VNDRLGDADSLRKAMRQCRNRIVYDVAEVGRFDGLADARGAISSLNAA
jgi:hypothetical protein